MRLTLQEFVSANPYMAEGGWRQELVRGEVRTLPPPAEAAYLRGFALAAALAACVRRAKVSARVETGGGIGVPGEEGDDFRVADVVIGLPDRSGRRHEAALAAFVVADADRLDEAAADRVEVFRRARTLKDILVFSASDPACRAYRRLGTDWSEELHLGAEALIRPAAIRATLSMLSVYPELEPPAEEG